MKGGANKDKFNSVDYINTTLCVIETVGATKYFLTWSQGIIVT